MYLIKDKIEWMRVLTHKTTGYSLWTKLNYAKDKKYTDIMVNDIINLLDL
jgi:hypothetical protein